jgi:tetratricopeptide (TPR) repeat protein
MRTKLFLIALLAGLSFCVQAQDKGKKKDKKKKAKTEKVETGGDTWAEDIAEQETDKKKGKKKGKKKSAKSKGKKGKQNEAVKDLPQGLSPGALDSNENVVLEIDEYVLESVRNELDTGQIEKKEKKVSLKGFRVKAPKNSKLNKKQREEYIQYAYRHHKNPDSTSYGIVLDEARSEVQLNEMRFRKAIELVKHNNYDHALVLFKDILKINKKNPVAQYWVARCNMFGADDLEKSIPLFQKAILFTDYKYNDLNGLYDNKGAPVNAIYYYALALHELGDLKLARKYFLMYNEVSDTKEKKDALKRDALKRLTQIAYAKKYEKKLSSRFKLETMEGLNTPYQEMRPFFSERGDKLYFTSTRPIDGREPADFDVDFGKGHFFPKLFVSERSGGDYLEPKAALKTDFEEVPAGFYKSGEDTRMALMLNNLTTHTAQYTLDGSDALQKPVPFFEKQKHRMLVGDAFTISPDGKMIVFEAKSSNKKGADSELYIIFKLFDNNWTSSVPLPSDVNSKYNDRLPIFDSKGEYLYFTSDRDSTFGGYDIFKTSYNGATWSKAENIGLPFNSQVDEMYYGPHPYIKGGVIARKVSGGAGGLDLYMASRGVNQDVKTIASNDFDKRTIAIITNLASGTKNEIKQKESFRDYSLELFSCQYYRVEYYVDGEKTGQETFQAPCDEMKSLSLPETTNFGSIKILPKKL